MPDHTPLNFVISQSPALRQTAYRRRWSLLAVTATIALTAVAAFPLLPTNYDSTASVLLQPTDQQGQGAAWDQMHALDENAVQTRMDIFRSHRLQQQVITDNHLLTDPYFNPTLRTSPLKQIISYLPMNHAVIDDPDRLTEQAVLKRLSVKRERRSYLLQVSYTANDPVKAADMTNTLVEGFIRDERARKMQLHNQRSAALQSALHDATERYQAAESAEHAFLISSGLIHRGAQDSLRRQLDVLSSEAAQAHARSTAAESRLHTLTEMQSNGTLDSAPEVLASPLIEHLRERLIGLSTGTGSATTMPMGATGAVLSELRAAVAKETQHVVDTARANLTEAMRDEDALRHEIERIDQIDIKFQEVGRTADALHRTTAADQTVLSAATVDDAMENGRGDVLQSDAIVVSIASPPVQAVSILPAYAGGSLALMILGCAIVLVPRRISHRG